MLKSVGLLSALVSFVLAPCDQLAAEDSPSTLEFRLADDNETPGWRKMEVRDSDTPIYVSNEASLHGGHIEKVSFQNDSSGRPLIALELNEEGGKAMKAMTSQNRKKELAIVLDGEVVSAATVEEAISSKVAITGNLDREDLLLFFHAIVLREMQPAKDRNDH